MQEKVSFKNKKAARLSALLMIFAVFAFAFAGLAGTGAFLIQALGLVSAAVGISMLIRYVLTDYLYAIENGHFAVRKINGKKSVWVADIPLTDVSDFPLTPEQYRRYCEENGKKRTFSFIKNLDSSDEYYLRCRLNGEEYVLRLELSEPFYKGLCKAIENAQNTVRKTEDEDE